MITTTSCSRLLGTVLLATAIAGGACSRTPAPETPASSTTPAAGTAPASTEDSATIDVSAPPPDVAAPPADAEKTPSGLASKRLFTGTGTQHPSASSQVTVHYAGWTTDGKLFDTSVSRGEPATFPLSGVIAGWTEGVQLMVVGEKRRFWIPEELAYQGQAGAPQGMLVFDVVLLSFEP